jgi:uncharacterized protein (DUF427 family)
LHARSRADGKELLPGYVTFHQAHGPQTDPKAMDYWFKEDEPLGVSPRDPYHRVDVRSSSRQIVVRHHGQVVAESGRPKLMFETGNPIRYYLPLADVRTELLRKSEFVSACPYKGADGTGTCRPAVTQSRTRPGACRTPSPKGLAAADDVCFYPGKIDVEVDGTRIPRIAVAAAWIVRLATFRFSIYACFRRGRRLAVPRR